MNLMAAEKLDAPGFFKEIFDGRTDFGLVDISGVDLSAAKEFSELEPYFKKHEPVLMFYGSDFSFVKASGIYMPKAIAVGADFSGSDFSGAYLREGNFLRANLKDADFFKADLRGANLLMACLEGVKFVGANMGENLSEVYYSPDQLSLIIKARRISEQVLDEAADLVKKQLGGALRFHL